MTGDPLFAVDSEEPLAPWWMEPPPSDATASRTLRFEFTSRGDRVSGQLQLPPRGAGPHPLVLVQHGLGGSQDAPYMRTVCEPWVRGGAAVASIDFPLHGLRASDKLSEALLGAVGGTGPPDGVGSQLAIQFARQAVVDLQRTRQVVCARAEVDGDRVAYAGFSLGAMLGALFCAHDSRVQAAALALGGGGLGPPSIDPVHHIARFAPRPLLFVNAERDERVPRERAEALYEAAEEPKERLWFDCGHGDLPGAALKAMWSFLRHHLGIVDPR